MPTGIDVILGLDSGMNLVDLSKGTGRIGQEYFFIQVEKITELQKLLKKHEKLCKLSSLNLTQFQ